ncbi:MAG: 3-deoxy-D-manno-octulosonic acid transferase [Deltaproteobacteria bacterium]|jgi:3-deoxy-D-manno-octulosonic-acid transferase|nr:3-deoxy-D-manno-octulosonic acid transferase [Deltaproteobacteria bacterium]MBQ32155.1 3-deoxy-D-manno-octulosonic acid transferase [Deltaproteobacteria bacterium]MDP7157671.1 glycosyltransferase N-terminal domain-containing protein [SAR324 cluster bacterium]MDP7318377.1 glycosyltransferase N-terminal domain-containing protein [SAR324 cluster bacterium]
MPACCAQWFYNLVLLPLLRIAVRVHARKDTRLREGLERRREVWERLGNSLGARDWQQPLLWFHVASAGELLQAQPVISRCVAEGWQCVLTYSSSNALRWMERPGGIPEVLAADFLPEDTIFNTRRLLGLIQPSGIVHVSYDLWPNLIWEAQRQGIPQGLISALVHAGSAREAKGFGRALYCSLYEALEFVGAVAEADQARILRSAPQHQEVFVMGDTRCDSVLERRERLSPPEFPEVASGKFILVAGSTWPPDEQCLTPGLKSALSDHPDLFVIIAPHEPTEPHLQAIETGFAEFQPKRWTQGEDTTPQTRMLVVDEVGLLAGLYRGADLAYVGGAFTTGVHNTLEPAAMGLPVIFGPRHDNSHEALSMVERGLAFTVQTPDSFDAMLKDLLKARKRCQELGAQAREFVEAQAGASAQATQRIGQWLPKS